MALKPITKEVIAGLEDDLAEVSAQLRKIRQEWGDSGLGDIPIEVEKAARFIGYLKETWAHRCYAQFRMSVTRETARKQRKETGRPKRESK